MKKHLLIFILLVIIFLPLSAQKKKDALYLKNGSVIYGKLVEITDNLYKIQTSDGSLFIYPLSDVEKLVKEAPLSSARKENGPGFALEAGFLIGAQISEYPAPFSFNVLGSYTLDTRNIFSLGSGVEFLGVSYSPLFLEYKFLLREKRQLHFSLHAEENSFIWDLMMIIPSIIMNTPRKTSKEGFRGLSVQEYRGPGKMLSLT